MDIRKFGLDHCDLPTMLRNVSVMLRILALNIYRDDTKGIPVAFYIFTVVIIVSYLYVYIFSMIWYSFIYCGSTPTCQKLSALIVCSLGVTSFISVCKLFYMYRYKNKIQDLVADCLSCESVTLLGDRFKNKTHKTMRIVKKRAMIFWIVIMSNGFVYIFKPLVTPGRHFPQDDFVLYGLNPIYESPNYEIVFSMTAIGVFVSVYLPSNITAFFITIAGFIEAQILALSEEMVLIWEDAKNIYSIKITSSNEEENQEVDKRIFLNQFVGRRLKDIIKIHISNINILRQIEVAFREAIAVEFILLITGLTSILLGGLENTYMQVPFGLMLVAADCFTGQKLTDASNYFENAVYFSKWENFDARNMKMILLVLQVSKNSVSLSAGGVLTLNLSRLMSLLKSIYSAFTALHSTLE